MSAGWLRGSAVVTLGLLLSACGPDEPVAPGGAAGEASSAAPRTPPAADELPNIIVYMVDTLRADGLGIYGNERDTSPAIDALARESAVFEMAVSQAPWTLPSVTSLFTSTYPVSHEVLSNFDLAGEQAETMVEFMHGLGYHTVGFITNTLGGKGAGLVQGYDEFFEHPPMRDLTPEQAAAGGKALVPILDWAAAYDGSQSVFVYIHKAEPHNPWEAAPKGKTPWITSTKEERDRLNAILPEQRGLIGQRSLGLLDEEQAARLEELTREIEGHLQEARDLYDGDVRLANENFQKFLAILGKRPRWEKTVLVLLADHGDELYEHGNWYHSQSLYQELVHVPLVLRVPGLTDHGLRIRQPVELIDVLPTLAELVGAPASPHWQGRSLVPLLRAARDGAPEPPAPPVFSMRVSVETRAAAERAGRPSGGERGDTETAVIEDGWKLIAHHDIGRASLYDLSTDPGEQHDLHDAEPERARHLLDLVQRRLHELPRLDLRRADAGDQAAQDEKLKHLEELGYIGGESPR